MAKTYDICIRGAGIVGRALALQLASKRLRVALVASAPGLTPGAAQSDVRAYALNQRSRQLLEGMRCWPDALHATAVVGMQVQGDGDGLVRFESAAQGTPALNWIVDVPALEKLLSEAVSFQPLIEVFETPQKATLTVVCEGKASSTRAEFGAEFDAAPYGQSALATRVNCSQPHGQIARQWFDAGAILAFLPLGGSEGTQCAVVWSIPPERAAALQSETEDAFCQALLAASHAALGGLTLTNPRVVWPLQHAQARRWSGVHAQGAWVLAGDAAHNVHPLAGQGLNLGLADADALARLLDTKPFWRSVADPRVLRQYERERKADFALVGGSGDALQRLFTHSNPAIRALRNWGMQRFERSGPLKQWVADRAMGTTAAPINPAPRP